VIVPNQDDINKISDSLHSMGKPELRNAIRLLEPVKIKEWRLISLLNYRLHIDDGRGDIQNDYYLKAGRSHSGYFDCSCGGGRRVIWKTEPSS